MEFCVKNIKTLSNWLLMKFVYNKTVEQKMYIKLQNNCYRVAEYVMIII